MSTLQQKLPSFKDFIWGDFFENLDVCDNLIDYFEDDRNKQNLIQGTLGGRVDKTRKDSTDLIVHPQCPHPFVIDYLSELSKVCEKYKQKYEWCHYHHDDWGLFKCFNVQKYLPNQGFHIWHTEKTTAVGPPNVNTRHLVFMTYLNDVTDGGETEWMYQQLKIKPQKGLTVIWPSEWTHVHRGLTSKTQTKYIATGWYNYKYPEPTSGLIQL